MTRKEAVKILRRNRLSYDEQEAEQFCEAYEMAISALEQPCDSSMEQALLLEVIDKFLPTECGDAISRDAVKEIINDIRDCISVEGYCAILERLKKLPPATPSITRDIEKSNFSQEQYLLDTDSAYQIGYEQGKKDSRRKGHWIEQEDFNGDTYYDCSECKESFCLIEGTPTDNLYNFCPNCGAEMVEPQESESDV